MDCGVDIKSSSISQQQTSKWWGHYSPFKNKSLSQTLRKEMYKQRSINPSRLVSSRSVERVKKSCRLIHRLAARDKEWRRWNASRQPFLVLFTLVNCDARHVSDGVEKVLMNIHSRAHVRLRSWQDKSSRTCFSLKRKGRRKKWKKNLRRCPKKAKPLGENHQSGEREGGSIVVSSIKSTGETKLAFNFS